VAAFAVPKYSGFIGEGKRERERERERERDKGLDVLY